MQRIIGRSILIFGAVLCVASASRADDRMTTLAERLSDSSAEVVSEPDPEFKSQPEPARTAEPASISAVPLENRPLGSAPGADAQIVTRPGSLDSGGSWVMSTLTSLGLVIALALVARWAWGKFGGRVAVKSSPVVEVLSRSSVAPRNHVLLLRVGARVLVVSDSPGGMRTLADIDDPEEVASLIGAVAVTRDNSITRSFTRLLQGYNREYDADQFAVEEGGDEAEHALDRARDSISGLMSRVRQSGRKGGGA